MKGRIYRVVEPDPNDRSDWIRLIDETGEDYPYPKDWFEFVQLSDRAIAALEAA